MTETKIDLQGKTAIITGATNGIGLVTAEALAGMGAAIVLISRNREKTAAVADQIRAKTGNASVHQIVGDLSVMHQVKHVAEEFLARHDRLDILVNNAGGIFASREVTGDGYEKTFALNHLNYFYLTKLLQDVLLRSAPARIVNVSSDAHKGGTINFDDLMGERKYSSFGAYAQSKLANVMFTYELAQRLEGSGVTANALHPGFVSTGFGRNNGGMMGMAMPIVQLFALSPERGAETSIYLASSPAVAGVSGKYFAKKRAVESNKLSYDKTAQRRLWDVSERLVAQAMAAA